MLTDELLSSEEVETLLASARDSESMSENLRQDRIIVANERVVTVNLKHNILRFSEGTEGKWFRTLPSAFVDGVWLDDILIVALTDRVVVFDAQGDLRQTLDISVQNLHVHMNQYNTLEVRMAIDGKDYRISECQRCFGLKVFEESFMPKGVNISAPSSVSGLGFKMVRLVH